jgi:pyruvate kinase
MLSTKIVCTIGPASDSPNRLAELAAAGMNVERVNYSHGTHDSHKKIIEQIRRLNQSRQFPIALLLDTQGPEIRTGNEVVTLMSSECVTVSFRPHEETDGVLFIYYPHLKEDL